MEYSKCQLDDTSKFQHTFIIKHDPKHNCMIYKLRYNSIIDSNIA